MFSHIQFSNYKISIVSTAIYSFLKCAKVILILLPINIVAIKLNWVIIFYQQRLLVWISQHKLKILFLVF